MTPLTIRKSSLISSQQEIQLNESQMCTYGIQGLSIMVTVRFSCCRELMFVHSILNVNRQYQILKLNFTTFYENCECYKFNLGTTFAYIGLTHKKGWTEISAQNLAKSFTVCSTHSSLDPILSTRMIRFMYTVVICNKFQVDFRKDWIWREKPSNHLVIFPRLS